MSTLNQRLKELRVMLKKNQSAFAEDLGTSQGHISQIEKGQCVPTVSFFEKLAETYKDVNMNWVIVNEGASSKSKSLKEIEEGLLKLNKEMVKAKYEGDITSLRKEIEVLKKENEQLKKNQARLIELLGSDQK